MKRFNFYLIVTALLLIVLGVVCILNPGEGFVAMAWLIGLLILLTGVIGLLFGMKVQRMLPNAGSTILLAVFQIVVGVLFLCNGLIAANSLIALFAIWVMFEGISLAILSFDYKRAGYDRWWLMALLGLCSMVLAFLALRNPAGVGTIFGVLLGVGIFANGIERIVAFTALKGIQKRLRDVEESSQAIDIDENDEEN